MSTGTLIPVNDYLASSYDPDCDYVDGHLEQRNWGEWDHASLQMRIAAYLYARQDQWGIRVVPELRVRVVPTRFRVPDVCVVLGEPGEQVLTKPPFICIEVLSPEDRMSRLQERIDDYLRMGVRYVWILDPATRKAYAATAALGLHEINDVLVTENPSIEVPLAEIFF
jgi:Uma2 family endonuclease